MADTYEKNLGAKSAITSSDYIRVVGSDNVSYKQPMSYFPTKAQVDALNSKAPAISAGASYTMDCKGIQGLLVIIGSSDATRGLYIVAGYSGSVEIASIKALTLGSVTVSGTNVTITNGHPTYSMNVSLIKLFG